MSGEPSSPAPASEGSRREGRTEIDAAVKFFRQWLREPRSIAALAPSGRELARRVAAAVGRDARTVVELGGGTGVITQALLERGIAPERLLVLERNPELHSHLEHRFPGVEVALRRRLRPGRRGGALTDVRGRRDRRRGERPRDAHDGA